MKNELVRSTWPKVRVVYPKGEKMFQVDARRKGTNGKQEAFSDKGKALERATAIAAEFATNGNEGLALPADLRFMAFKGAEMLQPYGKTILQACEHYRDYLAAHALTKQGETVEKLAKAWYAYKDSGKQKVLRKDSIKSIRNAHFRIIEAFGTRPVSSITEKDVRTHLDNLPIATQTKKGLRNLFGQFFNWCIEHDKGVTVNPSSKKIKYSAETRDVAIWSIAEATEALRLCETEFPDLTLFHAIGLFSGLRPTEAQQILWAHIDLGQRTIYVPKHISKVKDDRLVPIENNLLHWLELVPEKKRRGLVVRRQNFSNLIREFRARLGYKYLSERNGKALNPKGEKGYFIPDILRHSYGSYWLAMHANRAQLAENMGNSVEVIKDHYKRTVNKAVAAKFWRILPIHLMAKQQEEDEREAFLEAALEDEDVTPPTQEQLNEANRQFLKNN